MSSESISGPILTSDGIPLKVSLRKAERKHKIRALLLVAPLLLFIFFTFLVPIGDMLARSVDDRYINTVTGTSTAVGSGTANLSHYS